MVSNRASIVLTLSMSMLAVASRLSFSFFNMEHDLSWETKVIDLCRWISRG